MASRNFSVKYQEQKIRQQERLQRRARKDGDKGDFCWYEAGERLTRRMLKYLGPRKHESWHKRTGGTSSVSILHDRSLPTCSVEPPIWKPNLHFGSKSIPVDSANMNIYSSMKTKETRSPPGLKFFISEMHATLIFKFLTQDMRSYSLSLVVGLCHDRLLEFSRASWWCCALTCPGSPMPSA